MTGPRRAALFDLDGVLLDSAAAVRSTLAAVATCALGRRVMPDALPPAALRRPREHTDGFHNSRRIQKRLGCLSPVEFEEKHYADQATAERTNLKVRQPALTS
ncbi:hypothetical protein OG978_44410 (plasmid) [Streptomyces sp. NBC_01591]|uniref:hypothetical protein n=1 Tax=Streptomyces sp. NBC_01591 TaxID=2975888 RepID=UPI002DDAC722|nr:hypothetical protein [Streptomyces sp. NBC_01591]WSD74164.1 hypothetical protein OG978_44410 [Streptomyces sp. NBC_01591]